MSVASASMMRTILTGVLLVKICVCMGMNVQVIEVSASNENQTSDGASSRASCDLGGRTIRVAVSDQPPLVECDQDLFGEWLCKGSNIEVIRVLEQKLNFKSSWIVLASNHYEDSDEIVSSSSWRKLAGSRRSASTRFVDRAQDEQWSFGERKVEPVAKAGLFGLIDTGRVMLSANGFTQTLDRRDKPNLTVSEPFDSFRFHFLLSKSVYDHDHIFLKPFTLNAWLAILASAACVVPIFYLLNTTSRHYFLTDDGHLHELSLRSCARLRQAQVLNFGLNLFSCQHHHHHHSSHQRRSSASSNTSLEQKLEKVADVGSIGEHMKHYSKSLPSILQMLPSRGESKRHRRMVRRRWALERRRARKLGRRKRLKRRSGFFNLAYIVWYVVASLANQGGETEDLPDASSTRILVAFWWLYLIVICAIHSGILTAILTFPKQNDFIQTLDDYMRLKPSERAKLQLNVDKYSELAQILRNADELHKSPLQQLVLDSGQLEAAREPDARPAGSHIAYINFRRHRERVLSHIHEGRAALMEEKSTIRHIITQEYFDSQRTECLFKASRYPIDVVPMSLVISKQMPAECVERINKILRRIFITGLAQKWRRKFESAGNDCLNSVIINAGDVKKIELKHLVLAVWLLTLGLMLGICSLIVEVVWLFLFEDDDHDEAEEDSDEDSSSDSFSSSSSSSAPDSSDSDRVQLGFKRSLVALPGASEANRLGHSHNKVFRSLETSRAQLKNIARRTKRAQRRAARANRPRIVLSLDVQEHLAHPTTGGFDSGGQQRVADASEGKDGASLAQLRLNESEILPTLSEELRARRADQRRRQREAKMSERRNRRITRTVDFLRRLHSGQIYTKVIKNRRRRHRLSSTLEAYSGLGAGMQASVTSSARTSEINRPPASSTLLRRRTQTQQQSQHSL